MPSLFKSEMRCEYPQCWSSTLLLVTPSLLGCGIHSGHWIACKKYIHKLLSNSAPAEDNTRREQNNFGLHKLILKPRKSKGSGQQLCSDGETRKSWRILEKCWSGAPRIRRKSHTGQAEANPGRATLTGENSNVRNPCDNRVEKLIPQAWKAKLVATERCQGKWLLCWIGVWILRVPHKLQVQ